MRCGAGAGGDARRRRGYIRRCAGSAQCDSGGSPRNATGSGACGARGGADAGAVLIWNDTARKPATQRFAREHAERTEQRASEPSGTRESTWK